MKTLIDSSVYENRSNSVRFVLENGFSKDEQNV